MLRRSQSFSEQELLPVWYDQAYLETSSETVSPNRERGVANDKMIEQEGDARSGGAKGNLAHNSLENPATANEGSPHTEVTLRVLIEASNSAEREFWVTRMQAYGVKIQQSGQTGIDVKGTPDALSEALDVSVKVVDGETRLTGQPKKSSHENSDPPNAYVPRKPEMF